MTLADDLWSGLEPPEGNDRFRARRPGDLPEAVPARVALDHQGRRHLLIEVPSGTANVPRPRTRGLQVTLESLQTADGAVADHLDLACTEPAAATQFASVAAEVLAELAGDPGAPRETVARVLERWSWFWGVPSQGLSGEEVIGLFAELWFLERWIGPVTVDRLRAWTGPGGDRHDFKWPKISVEVKATRAPGQGTSSHRIANLDQLDDPEFGDLRLFSLRVTPDPIATHTLPGIVDRINGALTGDLQAVALWNERLGRAGYSPAHAERYREGFRIVAQELYRVDENFPRLIRSTFAAGVPIGVDDISYTVNLAACADHRLAAGPQDAGADDLRATIDDT